MVSQRFYTDEYNYINLNESNFKLDSKSKGQIRSKLYQIQEEVPQYSTISLNLNREQKDDYEYYHGNLKISTYSTNFEASSCHLSLDNLMINLEKDIKAQLEIWRQDRFQKRSQEQYNLHKLTGGYAL
jgi:hypothetical protein